MNSYTVSGVTPIGLIASNVKAHSKEDAKAKFLRVHKGAVEVNAVRNREAA